MPVSQLQDQYAVWSCDLMALYKSVYYYF